MSPRTPVSEDEPTNSGKQVSILTSVMPRWLVLTVALLAFGLFSTFLIIYLWNLSGLQDALESKMFARTIVAVFFAVYFSIFFFVFYPQEVVIRKLPGIDLGVRLVGPVALMILLLVLFMKILKADASFENLENGLTSISHESQQVRVFQADGRAHDGLELRLGERTVIFQGPASTEFREIERLYDENDEDKLYIKTKQDVYLGFIEDPRDPNDDIRLGVYYGECLTSGSQCSRRDPARAVEHIVRGVAHGAVADEDTRIILYFLMTEGAFKRCSDYTTLNEVLGKWDYHELAENHFKMYTDRSMKNHPQLDAIGRNALRYYLLFLSRAKLDSEPRGKVEGAVRAINKLSDDLATENSWRDLSVALDAAKTEDDRKRLSGKLKTDGDAQAMQEIVCPDGG